MLVRNPTASLMPGFRFHAVWGCLLTTSLVNLAGVWFWLGHRGKDQPRALGKAWVARTHFAGEEANWAQGKQHEAWWDSVTKINSLVIVTSPGPVLWRPTKLSRFSTSTSALQIWLSIPPCMLGRWKLLRDFLLPRSLKESGGKWFGCVRNLARNSLRSRNHQARMTFHLLVHLPLSKYKSRRWLIEFQSHQVQMWVLVIMVAI